MWVVGLVASAALVGQARADKIVAWGYNAHGQANVPSGTDFTAIAAGDSTGYALKSDGSIVAWGYDGQGEISGVPSGTDFTAIAGGYDNGYALEAVPAAVPLPAALPSGLLLLGLGGLGMLLRRRRA
jgi:hypothetical protein